MTTVWIDSPGHLALRASTPAAPGPGEALVRVAWAGICGSDREILRGTRPASYVTYPVVPGHEWSGTVTAVGPGVDGALVGRAVVGEGFRACRMCGPCWQGDTNLCDGPYDETGFTRAGAWADELVVPAALLHPLPDGTDLRAAAVLEPAACSAAACLRAAPVPGTRIAVVGAGTLGLLALQLLAAGGPDELIAIDPRSGRDELATACGATATISPLQAGAQPWRGRFDAVVETAGAPGSALLATTLARRGATVVLTGLAARDDSPLPPIDLVTNQLTVHTVFGAPSRAWTHAVRAFTSGMLRPDLVISHDLPLRDVDRAFELLDGGGPGVTKILLSP
ncbi:Threonine dehydrogenase [Parafrankia irregularis]|uniref:Threonine dehydrogenase n=1 Tax=Parafrankia irregularis TaxID=795642 RepID=A0A0S4QH23_9ACTN|nr:MULTISPECIES: alcohol dehydrogenase catalytic domain-containing protein [Parafrankia]MBE3200735.1 alcohol dehydrogenase catalytic domain-containing protein [Parafrankia sp. CH37]CUU54880.1 Threonine dehydrogenase [Parafrankia irregularis]